MKTKILIGILVSFLVISVVAVTTSIAANDKAKEEPKGPGDNAKAPDLEKIEFIHWKKGFGKPPCNNNGICEPELGEKGNCPDCKNGGGEEPPTTCYAFMGKYGKRYLKWGDGDLPVICTINPSNPYGLTEAFVTGAISAGADEWDWFTTTELLSEETGPGTAYRNQNYVNGISFGNYYSDPGIIGACTVWYSPATKQIVEFDIIFETDFEWGDADAYPSVMDLQNIATHELGHALGLADVYEGCPEVTMYGYSGEGETKKRTLEEPDVTGILILYPE